MHVHPLDLPPNLLKFNSHPDIELLQVVIVHDPLKLSAKVLMQSIQNPDGRSIPLRSRSSVNVNDQLPSFSALPAEHCQTHDDDHAGHIDGHEPPPCTCAHRPRVLTLPPSDLQRKGR
jgi:hypothetical protein